MESSALMIINGMIMMIKKRNSRIDRARAGCIRHPILKAEFHLTFRLKYFKKTSHGLIHVIREER